MPLYQILNTVYNVVRHVNIELVYITAVLVPQVWKADIGMTFTCTKMNNILLMRVNTITQCLIANVQISYQHTKVGQYF